jgi:hypothetical protein
VHCFGLGRKKQLYRFSYGSASYKTMHAVLWFIIQWSIYCHLR